ncbi:sensor histidine kinase [Leptospira congkakensis]|uniref:histidine kinase n=2 Tax=Leptospira congkakensis TaxID=2484932 RepID=A0A4Z1AJY1_9LEPT|nr:sensor histidine kinase [Leptospira congkakensis]TGL96962.1 sensor histidine kinase [Leptospira congkakensis]TGL97815.1 sensor histidine kinase [Leptospira congkakensis]
MSTDDAIKIFTGSLFPSLPSGTYILLSQTGEIVETYTSATNPWELGPSAIGKPIEELIPQTYVNLRETIAKVIETGIPFACSYSFSNFQLYIKVAPCTFPNEPQKFFLISALEITEETDPLANLSQVEKAVVQYEENLHKEIIKIFNWRHEIEGKGSHKDWMEKALPNLNTSLMQGSGLGALVTTVGSLIRKAKKEGDHYEVPAAIFELIEDNFRSTKKLVQTLAEAQVVFEGSANATEPVQLKDLHSMIQEEVSYLSDMTIIKNQRFHISNLQNGQENKFNCHFKLLRTAIRELLINAMKYGPDNSSIYILFMRAGEKLSLKILNSPMDPSIHQFDFKKSEEIILFQPFYRVNRYVDERYSKEEFGLGLGLPIVKKILEDMNAKIYFNVLDSNIYKDKSSEVSVTLEFDIVP